MTDGMMNTKRKFARKYFESAHDGRKEWAVTSDLGSLSFWVSSCDGRQYGGVENHYNAVSRPEYLACTHPHTTCELNGGFCWHDGSSLWASEWWIPNILPGGNELIWQTLERYYEDSLGTCLA